LLIIFSFISVESGEKRDMETVLACLFLLLHIGIAGEIKSNFVIICYLDQRLYHSACSDLAYLSKLIVINQLEN